MFKNKKLNKNQPARIAKPARQLDSSLGGGQSIAGGQKKSVCIQKLTPLNKVNQTLNDGTDGMADMANRLRNSR